MKNEQTWTRDEKAEAVLRKLGIDFDYKTIAVNEIDKKLSRINRARPKAIDVECAEDYAKAMADGDAFPAIVLAKIAGFSDLKYVIAGGNHRHMAAVEINGESQIMAACCCIDEIQFDVLCKSLNAVEGRRELRSVRVEQACDMCRRYGISPKEAASSMRVSVNAIQSGLRGMKVLEAAAECGVVITKAVSKKALDAMHHYKDDANVLRELARAAQQGMATTEIESLCSSLKDKKTEAERIHEVQSRTREHVPDKRTVTRSNLSKLMTLLGSLERLAQANPSPGALQITQQNAKEVAERWDRTKLAIEKAMKVGLESPERLPSRTRQLQSAV